MMPTFLFSLYIPLIMIQRFYQYGSYEDVALAAAIQGTNTNDTVSYLPPSR